MSPVWIAEVDSRRTGNEVRPRNKRSVDGFEREVMPRCSSRNGDQHVLAFDLDLIDGLFDLGTEGCLTRPDIELPAMPWASDCRSLDDTVGEWSALVRANSINGRDNPVDVIDRVDSPLEFDFLAGSNRQFIRLASLTNRGICLTPVLSRSRPAFSQFRLAKRH